YTTLPVPNSPAYTNTTPAVQPSIICGRLSGDGGTRDAARMRFHPGPAGRVSSVTDTHTIVVTPTVANSGTGSAIATPDFRAAKKAIDTANDDTIAEISLQALTRHQYQRSR